MTKFGGNFRTPVISSLFHSSYHAHPGDITMHGTMHRLFITFREFPSFWHSYDMSFTELKASGISAQKFIYKMSAASSNGQAFLVHVR